MPTQKKIQKILVANRGEIALRIMRSARELGMKTVAIYSEADRKSPYVRYADEAVLIGPPPSSQSYLKGGYIIEKALEIGADAIHPGYGFLSENAGFAKAVEEAGLVFIGPSARSIEIMGSKLAAKAAVRSYNIPLIPGTPDAVHDLREARAIANQIGYPVLVKASAGGGGKGMRIVASDVEFEEQMARATSEAQSAFGDSSVFIEKYITSPRHIEFQIMGDQHGNTVHLFERECSIQRRHQKVIEEAPSAVLTPALREEMGACAVRVAQACGYYGAGTVEFILDGQLNFYFLEMNTRLQVEHPVTESITGLDLVKEQIWVAEGKKLSFAQQDLKIHGHAMEIRVYAEDPTNQFLPDIGKLHTYIRPQGIGVRVDDGFEEGMEIPIYYDPMIAKLITFGKDRPEAIERMIRAIDDYQISGVQTTLEFCKFVMQHERFVSGHFDTRFIEHYFQPAFLAQQETDEDTLEAALGLLAYTLAHQQENQTSPIQVVGSKSSWKQRLY